MDREEILNLAKDGKIYLSVKPGASKSEIVGIKDGFLAVRINAQPEKGKANKELVRLFKKEFGLVVRIKSGESSRKKVLEVSSY